MSDTAISEQTIEYRIRWSASSNITFNGATDWELFDLTDAANAEEVEDYFNQTQGRYSTPEGFEIALEASGFEWWVETRESDKDA